MRAKKTSQRSPGTPKKRPPKKASATPTRSRTQAQRAAKPKPRTASPAKPTLEALAVYRFTAGGLLGYVRLTDPGRGIEFSGSREGGLLPAPCKEVLCLRHYLARGEGGMLAPREEGPCDGRTDKTAIVFRYGALRQWPVTATARYQLLPEGGLDATFAFSFSKALRGFEAAVETIMPTMHPSPHVHTGGRWTPVVVGRHLQRFYPRNLTAAELIADGRWNGLRMGGIGLAVEPQGYDYPMIVVWDATTGWALAHMALTEECNSLWVNGADRTIGLGLIGADVRPSTSTTCRVRVLLCRAAQLGDVLPQYRQFVQEARTTRKR